MLVSSNKTSSSNSSPSSESPKNEGFLKSLWHNLTDPKDGTSPTSASSTDTSAKDLKKNETSKDDKEAKKKVSGTGT
jgi:hypothetical protein